jgi:lysyl-tRNA synthetase class II
MTEAVKEYTGIDFLALQTDEEALKAARSIGVELKDSKAPSWGELLYECFDQRAAQTTPGARNGSSFSSAAMRWVMRSAN